VLYFFFKGTNDAKIKKSTALVQVVKVFEIYFLNSQFSFLFLFFKRKKNKQQ